MISHFVCALLSISSVFFYTQDLTCSTLRSYKTGFAHLTDWKTDIQRGK
jgi:hypothetical protein